MPKRVEDLSSLSAEDLTIKKLKIEVRMLENEYRESLSSNSLTRLGSFFQKNLGALVTIITLIIAVSAPFLNYIANLKKQQLIIVNKSILNLTDKDSVNLKPSTLLEIATQDPHVIAPYLLKNLNERKPPYTYSIDTVKIKQIYTLMYQVNSNLVEKSFWDKVIFLFVDDNQVFIEDKLFLNWTSQLRYPPKNEVVRLAIWMTYANILFDCDLQNDKRFDTALTEIKKLNEGTHTYDTIITSLETRKKALKQ